MERRRFIQNTALFTGLTFINPLDIIAGTTSKGFPVVRIPEGERNFQSTIIEKMIKEFQKNVKDEELGWLFNNCFPNTLDTTVTYSEKNGKPDTYVITGDIDAMWLRDSSAQVWPYMAFTDKDKKLKNLIAGVIHRQTQYILKDPFANAFYDDPDKKGEWFSDQTDMKPGVHERKWEIDSLCYPIRLGYNYWKTTGDSSPFDKNWEKAIKSILTVFKDQQKKEDRGSYSFQRNTPKATDTRALHGYGYPVNPVGLICSAFRPSDDASVYSFLIPSNFFAVVSLKQAAEMMTEIANDSETAAELISLKDEVEAALKKHAIVDHEKYGKIYAFEVDGFGNRLMMDDANVPSLLSLPYLDAVDSSDPIYQNTRKFVLSKDNPFYFEGKAAKGIGGPHVGMDMIWPMAITMQGLTSNSDEEIRECIKTLKSTHAGTGFMHETFHKDDPSDFTRSWFAWANTLFGEFLWETYKKNPSLLS
ncbi:glycoside hydrolase family 125 protein [Christiangramia sp. SM2212]|uniref:Glycoside hydrolase family 125 protein n=1 Tax=Christiangramia sediminicola TaxID=3073267 RepID=A0ABU1EL32_9FLAO|nr:glycoside hydrolase family 125 protein [Christiangramia sp. SM2212]MDR5589034.1 glycoside hydrolase family 125 protein [Christiangramia sp. SM2212]